MSLTLGRLKEVLTYNRSTGLFRWKVKTAQRTVIGDIAGCIRDDGYVVIKIDGKLHLGHRLAHIFVTGEFPKGRLDHRDTNKSNNKWRNLRSATHSQNLSNRRRPKNNRSGHKGVSWHPKQKRWIARICVERRQLHIGSFKTKKAASAAYNAAAVKHFGAFARAG